MAALESAYPDDGHIFVCVRVRDVPQNPCLTSTSASNANTNHNNGSNHTTAGAGNGGQPRKTLSLKEAQKICVSTLENIVVMHDPKSLDDASAVARDANNVVQLLTDRANAAASGRGGGGGGHLSERPSVRPSTRKSTGTRTRSSTGAGKKGTSGARQLIGTQTASYYECDQCIASMDEASMLKMPMIKNSDFLQPPPSGTQEDVYRTTAQHAVSAAVEGINSCVFAYGQTGSGKTYTLFGDTTNIRRDPGIVPRTLDDLFGRLDGIKASHGANAETDFSYSVNISFFEIYNNEVFCLFSRQGPLHVQFMRDPTGKKETMIISDLQQQAVTSAEKAYPLIEMGLRRRQTGETGMNARSSRSHAILQVRVTQWHTNRETRETVEHNATINLVDLAGSERQKTANTQGKNREEGIQINQSLATLARVINDIASGAKFVNYRDSLLTMVLKDNLGGNSKTFMIATVSPIAFSYQESCATLTYAKDVRRIRNRPVVNRTFQTKANLLEQNARLKTENEKLKEQMEEWMRRWNRGGPTAAGVAGFTGNPSNDISAITLSPEGTPGKDTMHSGRDALLETVALSPVAGGATGFMGMGYSTSANEALIAATSAAGLTAPLVISSHRKYANIAGIGGACVEGGVIRVTSLVSEKVRLRLADILTQGTPDSGTSATEPDEPTNALSVAEEGEDATPEAMRPTAIRDGSVEVSPVLESIRPSEHSQGPAPTQRNGRDEAASQETTSALKTAAPSRDLGYLEFERVGQRSCEQRFYVRVVLPKEGYACRAIVDIQVNGKSIGTEGRREMHHGDVVCAYLEDVDDHAEGGETDETEKKTSGSEQNLLAFHYVDLNCLSRTSSNVNHATLGQLAVSVDLPSEMEGLTLDDIQQLQRDRDKLLDLVQQQKQTIEYQCQQQKTDRGLSFISSISPSPEVERTSPEPRGLEPSPSMATPALAQKAALEAVKRSSISPSVRGRSMLPADLENEELLRRAQEQSQSQARLEGAIDENKQLHRAVATRNATLEALAKRLAELEAGGSPSMPRKSGQSSSSADGDDDTTGSRRTSPSVEGGESQSSPLAVGADHNHTASPYSAMPSVSRSLTRVSVSSSEAEEQDANGDSTPMPTLTTSRGGGGEVVSALPILRAQEIEVPTSHPTAFFESAEGARERYLAAVREAQLNDRIAELEAMLAELRAQLAMQESRLRVSKDDTLEQTMLREQVEAERDALLCELDALRAENAVFNTENEQLETFLRRAEEALDAALTMNEEELMKKAKGMAEQIKALKALARLWKRRAMKYIAMGFGDAAGELRHQEIPWDELRYGATAQTVKDLMDPEHLTENANKTIDDFEKETAVESVIALEAALSDLEKENRRLQDQIKAYEQALQELKALMERLNRDREELERKMRDNLAMDEEERKRLQAQLDQTNKEFAEAEKNSQALQQQLQQAVEQSHNNAKMTSKKHDMLMGEHRQQLAAMQNKMDELQGNVMAKDEELRTILRYMEDNDMVGIDGAVRDMELRNRIEDLIQSAMKDYDAPTGYSVFPAEFRFSDEMITLIRICLRILLDRLKIELYVLNKQNLHKFGLLVPTVQLRPEAQFQVFMHELRGVASEVAGRSQRIGGKWTVTEADVLSNLMDHRRRRAGGALYGLLIWYDHWDLSPKTEHVCYMELIRNADRIMQMARQVRQESMLNTNATSTLLMPIPSRSGKSENAFVSDSSRRQDKSVRASCRILNRASESTRRSNLAAALNEATPSKGGGAGEDKENGRPFSRSATALALSQNIPFSRTSSALPSLNTTTNNHNSNQNTSTATPGTSPWKPPRPTNASATPLPLGASPAAASLNTSASAAAHAAILSSPQHAPTPEKAHLATTPQKQNPHAAYSRIASAGVLPVTDNDVAFVAGSDVEQASSINRFNFERRMSLNNLLGQEDATGGVNSGSNNANSAMNRTYGSGKPESFSRRNSSQFSRCQTAVTTTSTAAAGPRKSAGNGRSSTGARAPIPAGPSGKKSGTGAAPSVAFGRSQSTVVKPSSASALHKGYELPRPSKKRSPPNAHPFRLDALPEASTTSLAHEESAPSPKPRTPVGVASKTRKPGATAFERTATAAAVEGRFAAPTSFYNPSIMAALRQRSPSDANRPSTTHKKTIARAPLAATKGHHPTAGPRTFKATPSTRSGLTRSATTATGLSNGSRSNHNSNKAAAKAGALAPKAKTKTAAGKKTAGTTPFESSRSSTASVRPRISATTASAHESTSATASKSAEADEAPMTPPPVPVLDFGKLAR